jgi:pilus assembly protein Flp/PilA
MGKTRQAQRLPDAAGGRAAGGLVARLSLKAFWADERGATAVEYGLIVACIFLAIVGGLSAFAGNETAMYANISNTIGAATH